MNEFSPSTLNYACAQRGLRHVFIRDLSFEALIGIHPHERTQKQPLLISIDVAVREADVTPSQLSEVVCYEKLSLQIADLVNAGHIDLVEALAEDIARVILQDFRILIVRVRVEKPAAIASAASVGVEIERHQR